MTETIQYAEISALSRAIKGQHSEPITDDYSLRLDVILEQVSAQLGIAKHHIKGRSRKPEYFEARWIAMYKMYNPEIISYKEVGEYFGRHHSTVIHACQTINDLERKHNPVFYEKFMLCDHV